jgi:hypothetical protein
MKKYIFFHFFVLYVIHYLWVTYAKIQRGLGAGFAEEKV